MGSSENSEETVTGKPLAFTSTTLLSGNETRVEGRLDGTTLHLRINNDGTWRERQIPWPTGALLAEGLRLASLEVPLEVGRRHRELSFQPSSLNAIEVTSTVGERESVSLPDGTRKLQRIDQIFNFDGTPVRNTAWVDAERDVYKLTMPAIGVDLTLASAQRRRDGAEPELECFRATYPDAVTARAASARAGECLRFTIRPHDHESPLRIPQTSEQRVERSGRNLIVEVRLEPDRNFGDAPSAADYAANDWLQSTAPEIIDLATTATKGMDDDAERMRALETFVRGFITDKNLGVGYASALQVARKPEGDCTEHAVLLAALGRSIGIATRVVDGLAYAPGFASARNVFVPHAWIQAWVNGTWQSYDAALAGFDAGHIAFSTGDGAVAFYQGLDLLGRLA